MRTHAMAATIVAGGLSLACSTSSTGGADASAAYDSGMDSASSSDSAIGEGGASTLCASTGGTVSSSSCCQAAGDFPDSCKVGACGCAPASSHTVKTCVCPTGKCFDTALGCKTMGS